MKYILNIVLLCFVLSSCNTKEKYIQTQVISNDLYVETYLIYSGGAYDGDSYAIYLTDSISYRKKLGYFENNLFPEFTIVCDEIFITWKCNDKFDCFGKTFSCNINKLRKKGYDDLLKKKYKPF